MGEPHFFGMGWDRDAGCRQRTSLLVLPRGWRGSAGFGAVWAAPAGPGGCSCSVHISRTGRETPWDELRVGKTLPNGDAPFAGGSLH